MERFKGTPNIEKLPLAKSKDINVDDLILITDSTGGKLIIPIHELYKVLIPKDLSLDLKLANKAIETLTAKLNETQLELSNLVESINKEKESIKRVIIPRMTKNQLKNLKDCELAISDGQIFTKIDHSINKLNKSDGSTSKNTK